VSVKPNKASVALAVLQHKDNENPVWLAHLNKLALAGCVLCQSFSAKSVDVQWNEWPHKGFCCVCSKGLIAKPLC